MEFCEQDCRSSFLLRNNSSSEAISNTNDIIKPIVVRNLPQPVAAALDTSTHEMIVAEKQAFQAAIDKMDDERGKMPDYLSPKSVTDISSY
jgi:hypothetical protein